MSSEMHPEAEEGERVGIFPSWRWVYGTVLVYGIVLIAVLILVSRLLDFGAGS
ncbi:MAG: hypothetical protein PVJ76_05595 [Gemmatimonadota bacterium]|jgi:hypothetical protein